MSLVSLVSLALLEPVESLVLMELAVLLDLELVEYRGYPVWPELVALVVSRE